MEIKILIAEKDIPVFINSNHTYFRILRNKGVFEYLNRVAYPLNEVVKRKEFGYTQNKLFVNVIGDQIFTVIHNGFELIKQKGWLRRAYIPKGSEYLIYGSIIYSNQLIVFSNFIKYIKWKLLK